MHRKLFILLLIVGIVSSGVHAFAQDNCDPQTITAQLLVPFSQAATLEELATVNAELTAALVACGITTGDTVQPLAGDGNIPSPPVISTDAITVENASQVSQIAFQEGNGFWIADIDFSQDGRLLASAQSCHATTCTGQPSIWLWDVATGTKIAEFTDHEGAGLSVAFSPDGTLLAEGDKDSRIFIRNVQTGEVVQTLQQSNDIDALAFSPDGTLLAADGPESTIWIWDLAVRGLRFALQGHTAGIRSVAFNQDGSRLVSGSNDGTVRVWDMTSGTEIRTMNDEAFHVTTVAFSPDGTLVASGDERGNWVRLSDVATGAERFFLQGHDGGVNAVTFSPDGTLVISGGNHDATIKIWDVATGTELMTLYGHTDSITAIEVSSDGRFIASASSGTSFSPDRNIRIWGLRQ